MRNFITTFFVLICVFYSKAQSDSLKSPVVQKPTVDSLKQNDFYRNTLSVNLAGILTKVLKPNATPDLNNSFLYYNYNFKNCFIRVGVNGWNTQNNQSNVQTNEQTVTNNYYSSAKLGFYITKKISKSFTVAYGLNALFAYVDSSTTFITPFDKVKDYATSVHFGVAPGVLLKYKINKRLSVFAEYMLPLTIINSKSGTNYSLFPNENSTDRKATNYAAQIYNPISIYISCSF
jgi:hypothetical protein